MFWKISVPKYFAKLTGKHLCGGLVFNKIVGQKISENSQYQQKIVDTCVFLLGRLNKIHAFHTIHAV